jgi:hypothetical protein
MTAGHPNPAGPPAHRPNDSVKGAFPGPMIPVLLSLTLMVGAVVLLYQVQTVVMLVVAVIAMLFATGFVLAWIGVMLGDRNAS